MRKTLLVLTGLLLSLLVAVADGLSDERCISMMGVALEGADSVFIPALTAAGFTQTHSDDDEVDAYYFAGDFYGIKSQLMVNVDEKTRLLTSVLVSCGPYRVKDLYERNQKYLIGKLQREWGNFKAKGDGSLYLLNDVGYIQQTTIYHDDGRQSIRYFYLNTTPYYKDAANMGLKGRVQEVITDNPVMENGIEHFGQTGRSEAQDIIDREYNATGYLIRAAMVEPTGAKSELTYEYDDEDRLTRRTLVNSESGIRSLNQYHYNDDGEMTSQSQKVFDKQDECILSITMKNNLSERDDNDNWTLNQMQLTYWEKGQIAKTINVEQRRTISYWDD